MKAHPRCCIGNLRGLRLAVAPFVAEGVQAVAVFRGDAVVARASPDCSPTRRGAGRGALDLGRFQQAQSSSATMDKIAMDSEAA